MANLDLHEIGADGISDIGSMTGKKADGTRDPNKTQFIRAARRHKHHTPKIDPMKDWKTAAMLSHPWATQLDYSKQYPKAQVPITGLDGGSTIYLNRKDLIDLGVSERDIALGLTAEDLAPYIESGELDLAHVYH